MRSIEKPDDNEFGISSIYMMCVAEIGNEEVREAFYQCLAVIEKAAQDYNEAAEDSNFVAIKPDNRDKDEVCLNGLSKQQFAKLYTNQLVQKERPRNRVYEKLKNRAPLGKCPFCGYCDVESLDHYLPKSKYPLLTVLPLNLVPSCLSCNTGKSNEIAGMLEEQILHPYYDHDIIMNSQWIFADVIESTPPALEYYVHPPSYFDELQSKRAENHFRENNLKERYANQASNEISTLPLTLEHFFVNGGERKVKEHLRLRYQAEHQKYKNSWKTALYEALSNSDWYCSGGFRSNLVVETDYNESN